jgi:hypothetical protein
MIDPRKIAEFLVLETYRLFGEPLISSLVPSAVSTSRGGTVYFRLETKQKHGIFSTIIKESWLQVSVSEQKISYKLNGEKSDGDMHDVFSVNVGLHYTHPGGGSNGSTIVSVWFDKDDNWIAFRKEGDDIVYNENFIKS